MTAENLAVFLLFYSFGGTIGYLVVRIALNRLTDWNAERKRRREWPEWERRINEAVNSHRES